LERRFSPPVACGENFKALMAGVRYFETILAAGAAIDFAQSGGAHWQVRFKRSLAHSILPVAGAGHGQDAQISGARGIGAARYSLTDAVAIARPVLQDVEVQMLGMRRIGPRPEYRGEPTACGDADGIDGGAQMLIPIGLDGQRFAIREFETRDVDRHTGRVRANLSVLGVVAVAAVVTRPGMNRLDFDRQLAGQERSDKIAQPMAEPFTKLTGKRRLIGQAD
jgi:hypothetical protein